MKVKVFWSKILRLLEENDEGMAVYDLAENLGLTKNNFELEEVLTQLINQNKIKMCIGESKQDHVCRFVKIIKNDISRRDLVGKVEDGRSN